VPTTKQVWVSDESGGVETILDAGTGDGSAPLPSPVRRGTSGTTRPATGSWSMCSRAASSPCSIRGDPGPGHYRRAAGLQARPRLIVDTQRAWVACDGNATLVVLRLADLRPLGRIRVGDDPDVLALDPDRRSFTWPPIRGADHDRHDPRRRVA